MPSNCSVCARSMPFFHPEYEYVEPVCAGCQSGGTMSDRSANAEQLARREEPYEREDGTWQVKGTRPSWRVPIRYMRRWDAVYAINHTLGRRHRSLSVDHLSKTTLNILHAYITGMWAFSPRLYNSEESPSVGKVRWDVAIALVNSGVSELEEYIAREGECDNREFRLREQRAIVEYIREADDQRSFAREI